MSPRERSRRPASARTSASRRSESPPCRHAARTALRVPLTDEQALAIATDEDTTLVLAGAGTGKTAVIIGKVAHLVRNEGVPPRELLVLAFNADAAEEVRQRLPADLKAANVFTFHAFGRRVIADTSVAPTISKLAQDAAAFQRAVDEAIQDILGDPRQSGVVTDFIAHHRAPYRSPFDFGSAGAYYEYVRNSELRTLSGDLVKSVEELEIANFLTLNGVEFRYEQQFPERTATQEYSQYQPDFYLPAHDIYIEHFALDENDRPPPTWRRYAEGVEWKRAIHAELDTRLIETYSWQHREGVLRNELQQQLEAAGVAFEPIPIRSVIARLGRWLISWLARLLTTFLHHVKTSGLSAAELHERARTSEDRARSESFLAVVEQVRERYEAMLAEEGAVDFHDLINRAAALIRDGAWQAPYRYILVDEFQDISAGRMATEAAGPRSRRSPRSGTPPPGIPAIEGTPRTSLEGTLRGIPAIEGTLRGIPAIEETLRGIPAIEETLRGIPAIEETLRGIPAIEETQRTSSSATTGSRSTVSRGATSGSCGTAATTSATCGSARSARPSASPTASCGPRRPSCSATPRRRSARCDRRARIATTASPSSPTATPVAASGARYRTSSSVPRPAATTPRPCSSSAATGTARARRRASRRCASSSAPCTARRAARPTTPSCSTSRTSGAGSHHRSRTTRCWTSCSPRARRRGSRTPRSAASSTSR